MDKETTILKYMQKLEISREEAEELYIFDNSNEKNGEVEKLTAKAKQLPRRYEQSTVTKKTATPRERKVDTDKAKLLQIFEQGLQSVAEIISIKTETEIKFSYNGNNYTLKLTKNRNK